MGQLIKSLLCVLAFGLVLGGEPGRVYADDNYSPIIIAQVPPPSPPVSPTPSPPVTPRSPSSTNNQQAPSNNNNNQARANSSQNTMNFLISLLLLEGFVILGFKGIEVFYNQRKMVDIGKTISEAINKLLEIPQRIEELNQTVKELKNQQTTIENTVKQQLNDKIPEPIKVEILMEQVSKNIKQAVKENLDEQFKNIIPLVIKNLKDDSEFVEIIAQAVVSKLPEDFKKDSEERKEDPQTDLDESNLLSETDENSRDSDSGASDEANSETESEESSTSSSTVAVSSSEEQNVVNKYNDKVDFKESKIEVTTTKDTELEARTGREYLAILTCNSEETKMYWIIKGTEGYYLVPRHDKKFNDHQMKSVQNLFECEGYIEEITNLSNFRLKKPAKVSVMSSGETWVLDNDGKGLLDFSG
ncbi:hypothetical protein [Gloeothece verrucosa]|uniref:Uncharacterized protein n=1 Tax=Gloeothece verrucosa (strain PCC 7822) TaxID=497965 RepID=E0UNW9_GLOV7|nr:hypothetical protein [Gloeothece verrucosa]ADN18649.1 hypothetical protein Cyan7822_6704 [Gloeothece verrucosa PCC 7822]